MTVIYIIILVILLFAVLIFPHELGHMLAARACNVQVNEFAFGMGPILFKKQGKETLYTIRAIPIGGFTAMEGEDTEESGDNPRAFNNKKWWQKIIILFAGAAMNFFTAFIILTIICAVGGQLTTTIADVTAGSPAAEAGIEPGDRIVEINGTQIDQWSEISEAFGDNVDENTVIDVTVERGGSLESFSMTPERSEDGRYIIGITSKVEHNVAYAVRDGAVSTGQMTKYIFKAFGDIFKSDDPLDSVSGPVGIVQVVSDTTQYGFLYYLYIVALVCVNVGIFNLLPLPALDGGRIIFVFIRLATGKAISDRTEGIVHSVGLALLMGLAIFVTGHDIIRLLGN